MLLGLAGCVVQDRVSPMESDELIVHSVLDPSSIDQYVVVQKTSGYSRAQAGETNARVSITDADGHEYRADAVVDSTYYRVTYGMPRVRVVYRIAGATYGNWLRPNTRYDLLVLVGAADTVRASTVTPNVTSIGNVSSTAQPFRRMLDTLRLEWSPANDVVIYEVGIQSAVGSWYSMFAQRAAAIPGTASTVNGGRAFIAGQMHDVVINAVDRNYFDYYRASSDQFTGAGAIVHMTGASGVFGSIARVGARRLDVQ